MLEEVVKPKVEAFLKVRGLTLSPEKTLTTHIDTGFDFLGFNVRKYREKLIIKPSKTSINSFLARMREAVRSNRMAKTENLIRLLNPKITGWTNYFRHVCSKKIFSSIDHKLFLILWDWSKRRHSNKSNSWIWNRYFGDTATTSGTLSCRIGAEQKLVSLKVAATTPIRRHLKVKGDAHPFDPDFTDYFASLKAKRKTVRREALSCF